MGNKIIQIEDLSSEISGILQNYNKAVIKGLKSETQKAMKELVKGTKKDAPVGKRHHHYRDYIKSKKTYESDDGLVMTWYVSGSDYRLSHLLEKGHATRNGGRTKAFRFIEKNLNSVQTSYENKIKEVIERG